jgi:hypothetical protein
MLRVAGPTRPCAVDIRRAGVAMVSSPSVVGIRMKEVVDDPRSLTSL